jgi:hypothetical protein
MPIIEIEPLVEVIDILSLTPGRPYPPSALLDPAIQTSPAATSLY